MTDVARKEIRVTGLGPEALAGLTKAYDEACAELASLATDENRMRVAHAIVAYARSGTMDPETLKALSVRLIRGD